MNLTVRGQGAMIRAVLGKTNDSAGFFMPRHDEPYIFIGKEPHLIPGCAGLPAHSLPQDSRTSGAALCVDERA